MSEHHDKAIAAAMPEPEDLLSAVARLSLRSRAKMRALTILFVFDVLLTFGVGYTAYANHHQSVQADQKTCRAGNAFRTNDKKLWDYAIGLVDRGANTATHAELNVFHRFVDQTDKLRQC